MNWRLVDKSRTVQPTQGRYKDWKNQLAAEGYYQCVYCSIHENRFGGTRNFAVEHHRPKSKFKDLENDIFNLFYACSICNGFKGDDWYEEELMSLSGVGYPNPSKIDYSVLFLVTAATGEITGVNVTGRYIVERLYLNRPQLILDRRLSLVREKLSSAYNKIQEQVHLLTTNAKNKDEIAIGLLGKTVSLLVEVNQKYLNIDSTRPYTNDQIIRPQ